jgi:hypothetical protein
MTRRVAAGGEGQLRLSTPHDAVLISRMKGHEDDGMFFGADEALPIATIQPLPAE